MKTIVATTVTAAAPAVAGCGGGPGGPGDTPAEKDAWFVAQARSLGMNENQSLLIAMGHSICDALRTGFRANPSDINPNPVDRHKAQALDAAAHRAYCPDVKYDDSYLH